MSNIEKFPRVTEILKGAGLIDLSCIREDVLERAAKFGTAVHLACELHDKNTLDIDKLDPALFPYLEGWRKFKKDYDTSFNGIEQVVYSDRWKFRGTLDRIGMINHKLTLIDIKSSTSIFPSTAIQLAAYQLAWQEMAQEKIKQRWCVQLTPDGYTVAEYKNHDRDKSVFVAALTIYNWKKENKLWKP